MNCNCLFCPDRLFTLNESAGLLGKDSIIYEDDYIFVTPDIAPLVVGHYLIVSKEHINSFAGAGDNIYKSLHNAKKHLTNSVFKETGCMFFEHGAVIENTAGSTIDHAHIHALPFNQNIHVDDYIRNCGFITSEKTIYNREQMKLFHSTEQPYVFYKLCEQSGWVYPVDVLPHQFFRMMIAHFLNISYNWRTQYQTKESKSIFNDTLLYANISLPSNQEASTL